MTIIEALTSSSWRLVSSSIPSGSSGSFVPGSLYEDACHHKATTFGSVFTTLAVVLYSIGMFAGTSDSQFIVLGIHAAIVALALAFTNAVSSHAIAEPLTGAV